METWSEYQDKLIDSAAEGLAYLYEKGGEGSLRAGLSLFLVRLRVKDLSQALDVLYKRIPKQDYYIERV